MAEPRQYTAGEAVRLAGLVARTAAVMARGGSVTSVDRAITKLQEEACAREAAQDKARAQEVQKKADEKTARRAARRFW
ncbi:hypothetical protein OG590_40555 (plasmid) [Streptomyces goshikiensis]|uniref:hypothetical protein n=1 Tax=Streptomyces goshikiensis TaxID=1942 RepID=UPI00386F77EF|nr:hypothetical protein OG590_40555 [Streptomyces goshikiensis]